MSPDLRPTPSSWASMALPLVLLGLVLGLGCHPVGHDSTGLDARPVPEATVVARLDPAGVPPWDQGPPLAEPVPPRVVEIGPQGDVDDGYPQIYVRFNQAMTPPPEGDPSQPPLVRLEPAVRGTLRWPDPYQLTFQPDTALKTGETYAVVVEGSVPTTDGRSMTLSERWTVAVQRPEVDVFAIDERGESYYIRDGEAPVTHWKARVVVVVDRAASLDQLREHLVAESVPEPSPEATPRRLRTRVRKATAKEHRRWAYGDEDRSRVFVVEPVGHWPADSIVSVRVGADFRAEQGSLTLGREQVARLVTHEGLSVKLSCYREYDVGCDPGPVQLRMGNAISKRELSKISVSPRPPRLRIVPGYDYGDGLTEVSIDGRFQPGRSYTISLPSDFRDVYGQGLAEPLSKTVEFVTPPPSIALSNTHGFLPATRGTTVGLEARSVTRARLRVAVLGDDAALARAATPLDEGPFPAQDAEVTERVLDLDPQGRFEWAALALDLATFTKGKRRAVFVQVDPLELTASATAGGRTMPESIRGLFQLTELGALSMISSSRSVARITELSTGRPRAGAEVRLFAHSSSIPARPLGEVSRSGPDGLAALPAVGELSDGRGLLLVRDEATDDRFVLGSHGLGWISPSPGKGFERGEEVQAAIATERPLYRPGETIHVVGWAAVSTPHTASGLRPLPAKTTVELLLRDRAGDVAARRTVRSKAYGKFWAKLPLPEELSLGAYTVEATLVDTTATARVRVKEFRTPPFSVDAAVDEGDVLHGARPRITASASYYFGGSVPITSARRRDACVPTRFRPSGLETRWRVGGSPERPASVGSITHEVAPDPDDRGRLQYTFELSALTPSWAYQCTSSLAVQDAAAAEVGAVASFMVHPSRYLMLAAPSSRLEGGDTVTLPVRAVTHDAERIAKVPVKVTISREVWEQDDDGLWIERTTKLPTCTATTTAAGDDPQCRLSKLRSGRYTIVAETTDDGPGARVELQLWVGRRFAPPRAPGDGLSIEVSDPEPRPGDRVDVTVRSPEPDARGVLVLMHGGLRTIEPFRLRDGVYVHSLSVVDAWVPQVEVEAIVVHAATAEDRELVERADARVRVTPEHRTLNVAVHAPDVAGPRQTIPIELSLADADGEPIAGHVALWAVDEAILSLAPPRIPELVDAFVIDRGRETWLGHDFELRLFPYTPREDPYVFGWRDGLGLTGYGSGGGGYGGGGGRGAPAGPSTVRKSFDTTPIFMGDVTVGRSGRATVRGTLPDDLTTFRITAIASATLPGGDAIGRFGHADTRVRVTAPLVVQSVMPRHLRPGDTAEAAALIDNLGGPAGTLTVVASVADDDGVLHLLSAPTKVVRVEAGQQVRVPYRLRAVGPGTPRVTLSATLSADEGDARLSDAIELPIPIEIERGLEHQVAVYGSVDDDEPIAVALRRPTDTDPEARDGGIDVALSSTLLGGARDMVEGLVEYPYGCVEQTTSRLLPLAALGGLARNYPLGVPDLDRFVRDGVTRLRSMQTPEGGLGYWPGDEQPHAYATAYATWVLLHLRDAGYSVPPAFLDDLQEYLAGEVLGWSSHGTPRVGDDVRLTMALVALAELDDEPRDVLLELYERRHALPQFTRAMVLLALHRSAPTDERVTTLANELLDGLDEREGFAHVRDRGGWLGAFFDSGPRTEAMVLLALLHAVPEDRRVEKLVRGLMSLHRAGALRNTQERAYALLALAEYARRFEAVVPAFDTAVWVDTELAGTDRFEGRSADVQAMTLPLPWLPDAAPATAGTDPFDSRVTLSRRGEGRMYWRVAMRWVPDEATIEPHAAGITVERSLRTMAGELGEGDSIGHGELVALDLTLTTNDTLDYVAVDVPLPAGLEAVDTSLGKGRRAMVLSGRRGRWVSHTELRSERALVFADRLAPGEHQHTVYLRAVVPGESVMPPARAEAMYYPEVQGHTAARTVRVK